MSGGHYVEQCGDKYTWTAWISRDGIKTIQTGQADDAWTAHGQAEMSYQRLVASR